MHERPLVIVPPNINKFYILDLQPENSFVRHAVEQGYTVFLVSWRNPVSSDTDGIDRATWSDYLGRAQLRVASDITKQPKVNALGFCVGGTMLASALALAEARGEHPVASLTLLTTLLDFHDTGVLKVFVDEAHALLRDHQFGSGGLMPGRDLATTFSFLRPNELVWNYVVGNYLKARSRRRSTCSSGTATAPTCPGRSFLVLPQHLPGKQSQGAGPGAGRGPAAGPDAADHAGLHIRFARGPYRALDGGLRVHAAAARTAALRAGRVGTHRRRGQSAREEAPQLLGHGARWRAGQPLPGDPNAWLAQTVEQPGSWWPDWSAWLAGHSGKQVKARVKLGNASHRPIEPAPGRYVKVRAA